MEVSIIASEVTYKNVRSSGAGGQNVNKVASKAQIYFNIQNSAAFSPEERELLLYKLANRISKDGEIILESDETRSQLRNKDLAFKKLTRLLEQGLKTQKTRTATKIPRAIIQKRLNDKKINSLKKENRKFRL